MRKDPYLPYKRLVWAQLGWVILLCLLSTMLVKQDHASVAILVGGLSCWVANAYYAWRVLKIRHARQARQILAAFFLGEGEKWLIAIGLLIACLSSHFFPVGMCVLGFVLSQQFYWAAPFFMRLIR